MLTPETQLEWGREQADRLLTVAAAWLEEEAREERWRTMLARDIGCLAILGRMPGLRTVAESVLERAPVSAFTAGILTNVPDLQRLVRRDLPSDEALEAAFPNYVQEVVLERLGVFSEPHIALTLAGDLTGGDAASSSESDRAREEFVETCAVIGEFGWAERALRRESFPRDRRVGPLMVLAVEAFRRCDETGTRGFLAELGHANDWVAVALASGFLGRIPWHGYPYPDY